jgi:hypothetical protein
MSEQTLSELLDRSVDHVPDSEPPSLTCSAAGTQLGASAVLRPSSVARSLALSSWAPSRLASRAANDQHPLRTSLVGMGNRVCPHLRLGRSGSALAALSLPSHKVGQWCCRGSTARDRQAPTSPSLSGR